MNSLEMHFIIKNILHTTRWWIVVLGLISTTIAGLSQFATSEFEGRWYLTGVENSGETLSDDSSIHERIIENEVFDIISLNENTLALAEGIQLISKDDLLWVYTNTLSGYPLYDLDTIEYVVIRKLYDTLVLLRQTTIIDNQKNEPRIVSVIHKGGWLTRNPVPAFSPAIWKYEFVNRHEYEMNLVQSVPYHSSANNGYFRFSKGKSDTYKITYEDYDRVGWLTFRQAGNFLGFNDSVVDAPVGSYLWGNSQYGSRVAEAKLGILMFQLPGNYVGYVGYDVEIADLISGKKADFSQITQASISVGRLDLLPTAPVIITQPRSITVEEGQSATFSVVAESTTEIKYQWFKEGATLVHHGSPVYTIDTVRGEHAGRYHVIAYNSMGGVASQTVILTVGERPRIMTQPASEAFVFAGKSTTLKVLAATNARSSGKLTYQWQLNGQDIPKATKSSLAIKAPKGDTGSSVGGQYTVVVKNSVGSVTSQVSQVRVIIPANILVHPTPGEAIAGNAVTFSVTASGTGPLSYQWRRNGKDIIGASSPTLTVEASKETAGKYTVLVTNGSGKMLGKATSKAATLKVGHPPEIISQPATPTILLAGKSVTLSVKASGTAKLTYQWQRNGIGIPKATGSKYTIKAAKGTAGLAAEGIYTVVVKNTLGSVISAPSAVSVIIPVSIIMQPVAPPSLLRLGDSVTLSVSATGTGPLFYQWKRSGKDISGANSASLTLVGSLDRACLEVSDFGEAG
jgi:hypothetical protein